jgi:hypothetical protein
MSAEYYVESKARGSAMLKKEPLMQVLPSGLAIAVCVLILISAMR